MRKMHHQSPCTCNNKARNVKETKEVDNDWSEVRSTATRFGKLMSLQLAFVCVTTFHVAERRYLLVRFSTDVVKIACVISDLGKDLGSNG